MSRAEVQSLVLTAYAEGREKWVKILLESGEVDVNMKDSEGKTLLMKVCSIRGHIATKWEIIKLLLNKGALVDVQDNEGKTALMRTCEEGTLRTVQVLLDNEASVDIHDNEGKTALKMACERGHTLMVKSLLTQTDSSACARQNCSNESM